MKDQNYCQWCGAALVGIGTVHWASCPDRQRPQVIAVDYAEQVAAPYGMGQQKIAELVETMTEAPKHRWTYSFYKATLYLCGKFFSLVTGVNMNGINLNDADTLLSTLNGVPFEPSMVTGKPFLPSPTSHDWPEDFVYENGCYECHCVKCSQKFYGYKRRVLCRKCEETK